MDDEVRYRVTTTGEVSRLVATYRRAVRGADRLRAGLIAAGLEPDGVRVSPGVGAGGEATVHVTVFPAVAVELAELIADDQGGAPPRLAPRHPRGDPHVA
ncbi:MAG: hypothetical protein JO115_11075 [Pseudonocardiales bacterium]|nr:hypothetical protein [Pseudonocardiales bacterium]